MAGRDVLNRTGLYGHASQCLLRQIWRAARRWHQAKSDRRRRSAGAAPLRYRCRYWLFLDEGLNYSCAFFEDPVRETIEHAQLNKLQRITAKLDLRAGMAVAEICSDWGSPVSPARV
jgi:cyclopropane-fatty-acyl-phospholipid synthase